VMRLVRPWLVVLLVSSLAPLGALAQPAAPADSAERATSEREFSYEDLTRFILRERPEVAERPISLVLLWNRTDSVNGLGAGYQVLPNVWKNELLGRLLDNFLVHGYERADGAVAGDRVMMLAFGQQRVDVIVPDQPFRHADRVALREAYPIPFVDTPEDLRGLDLQRHVDDAIAAVEALYGDRNLLMLVLHDDVEQGALTGVPQANAYRTYEARLSDDLQRGFTVYFYWNDFPDERAFVYFDEATASIESESRTERVAAQDTGERPPEFFGDTVVEPAAPQERLTIMLAGDGRGVVRSSPAGIDTAAGRTSAEFNRGSVVSLTAAPSGLARFGGFTVAPEHAAACGPGSTETTCVLTMDAARSLSVAFIAPPPFDWRPLVIGLAVLALVTYVLRTWLLERYVLRDERGMLDRTTAVFPGRSKRIAVPNPVDPNEAIGYVSVTRPLPFGLSRLRFVPTKGYAVALEGRRGAAARAERTRSKKRSRGPAGFVLTAGRRKAERHVLRYLKGAPRAADGADAAVAADPSAIDTEATLAEGTVVLSVQHLLGAAKRKRKRSGKASDDAGRGGRRADRTGRRGKRRLDLSDMEEGAAG